MEKLVVRNAEQYFREFAVNGIGKGADKWMIRRQLIDAFKKEIFGLAAMRMRDNGEKTEENERILHNIVKDAVKKWQKLCEMFEKYNETKGVLKIDDLMMEDDELFEGISQSGNANEG